MILAKGNVLREFSLYNFRTVVSNIGESAHIKSIVAILFTVYEWTFVGVNAEALLVVYALVIIDTVTGIMIAFEQREISSAGFFRFAGKVFVYLLLMATAGLVDRALPAKFAMSIMYAFLAVTEGISILENLSVLGYPVPTKLLKSLKIMNTKD